MSEQHDVPTGIRQWLLQDGTNTHAPYLPQDGQLVYFIPLFYEEFYQTLPSILHAPPAPCMTAPFQLCKITGLSSPDKLQRNHCVFRIELTPTSTDGNTLVGRPFVIIYHPFHEIPDFIISANRAHAARDRLMTINDNGQTTIANQSVGVWYASSNTDKYDDSLCGTLWACSILSHDAHQFSECVFVMFNDGSLAYVSPWELEFNTPTTSGSNGRIIGEHTALYSARLQQYMVDLSNDAVGPTSYVSGLCTGLEFCKLIDARLKNWWYESMTAINADLHLLQTRVDELKYNCQVTYSSLVHTTSNYDQEGYSSVDPRRSQNRPIQLVSVDDNGVFSVCEDALALIRKLWAVAVVTTIGRMRGGKSRMLNFVLEEPPHGFVDGNSTTSCTRGIWMWTEKLIVTNNEYDTTWCSKFDSVSDLATVEVLVLDCEGSDSPDRSRLYDHKIYSLATMLSSMVIYNCQRALTGQDIKLFQDMAAERVKINTALMLSAAEQNANNELLSNAALASYPKDMRDVLGRIRDYHGSNCRMFDRTNLMVLLRDALPNITNPRNGELCTHPRLVDYLQSSFGDNADVLSSMFEPDTMACIPVPQPGFEINGKITVASAGAPFLAAVQRIRSLLFDLSAKEQPTLLAPKLFAGGTITGAEYAVYIKTLVKTANDINIQDTAVLRQQMAINATQLMDGVMLRRVKQAQTNARSQSFYGDVIKTFKDTPLTLLWPNSGSAEDIDKVKRYFKDNMDYDFVSYVLETQGMAHPIAIRTAVEMWQQDQKANVALRHLCIDVLPQLGSPASYFYEWLLHPNGLYTYTGVKEWIEQMTPPFVDAASAKMTAADIIQANMAAFYSALDTVYKYTIEEPDIQLCRLAGAGIASYLQRVHSNIDYIFKMREKRAQLNA